MLPGQNNNRSERKKLLQQQRLEKRRNWRLQNRKKAPAKPNQPTVDDYKRTVKGKSLTKQMLSHKAPANQVATQEYQFEIPSK